MFLMDSYASPKYTLAKCEKLGVFVSGTKQSNHMVRIAILNFLIDGFAPNGL
jgi:hypothetical protein